MEVPIQSDPVSPPPITMTSLPVAFISSPKSLIPSTRLLFCLRKSIACTTPLRSAPFVGSPLLMVAPPERTKASNSFFNSSAVTSTPTLIPVLKTMPSASKTSSLLSITCFSILKSGMPYLSRPPTFSSLSKTVTKWPALFNCWAAARPAGPEPITAMDLPVLLIGGSAVIHPFVKAVSTIFFSMFSIETGSSLIPKTQASSQGAGHNLPVNSGKLLVECNIFAAFSHLPL